MRIEFNNTFNICCIVKHEIKTLIKLLNNIHVVTGTLKISILAILYLHDHLYDYILLIILQYSF